MAKSIFFLILGVVAGGIGQAGFQSGDVIFELDGKEFEDQSAMMSLFMTARAKKQATVTVDRGGRQLEITIDPKKFFGGENMGGSVDPTSR